LVSFLQQIPGFLELVEAASAAVVDFSPLTPLPFCWHSSVAAAIICSPQFLQWNTSYSQQSQPCCWWGVV